MPKCRSPRRLISWLERSPHKRNLGVRISAATDQGVNTGSDSSIDKRSAIHTVSQVLGDDHYKQMARVRVGVARQRTLTAQG